MSLKNLIFEREGYIAVLTINRPDALNALNSEVIAETSSQLDVIAASDLRCLIVTGAGPKAFVAGADLKELENLSVKGGEENSAAGNNMMEKFENLPIPVIAAVNGFALGGGCEVALSCDIRLAASNAVFALPEVGLGIIPGYGGVQRLIRTIGIGRAKEMIYTTGRVKADEALSIGLVNAVYAPEELLKAAKELAGKIAANSPIGVRGAKKLANASIGGSLSETYRLDAPIYGACFTTQDQRMAMNAFVNKRKPEPFIGK
jgi:enoyl-CoA hydratase